MSTDTPEDQAFDQYSLAFRDAFPAKAAEVRPGCPVAWNDHHDGFWVISGHEELRSLARQTDLVSNDKDPAGVRTGYQGIGIPTRGGDSRSGFLEMDPPEQSDYRRVLNPLLSPAGIKRWEPMVADLTRAAIDAVIESGRADFVDDLANVVPSVTTMALLGLPLDDWEIYSDPIHLVAYTPPESPEFHRVFEMLIRMAEQLEASIAEARVRPRPGMLSALLGARPLGEPIGDDDLLRTLMLLIGGGFDTTTSLTAGTLEWLDGRPDERVALRDDDDQLNVATEEFLRYLTPAQGNGRTITRACELGGQPLDEGARVWLSYAMGNHDPEVFAKPDEVVMDRFPNPHAAFGLGVHRCIGSNLARTMFKHMLREVLRRMPDFRIELDGVERYESIGLINGYRHLPASFTPGRIEGPPMSDVIAHWQTLLDAEQPPEASR